MEIRVTVTGSAELDRALARAPGVVEKHVDMAILRGAVEVGREARGRAPKAFSNLVNSIRPVRIGSMHYAVGPGVNYGRMVEEGTPPGKQPPTAALQPWVERVLGLRGDEAHDAAFMVARAIARRGTRAQPYLAPAAEAKTDRVVDLVRQGVARGIDEALR